MARRRPQAGTRIERIDPKPLHEGERYKVLLYQKDKVEIEVLRRGVRQFILLEQTRHFNDYWRRANG